MKGIIMSPESVDATIAGHKTETRRVVKPQPPSVESVRQLAGMDYGWWRAEPGWWLPAGPVWAVRKLDERAANKGLRCPYGAENDLLWVRERWRVLDHDFADPKWVEAEGKVHDWRNHVGGDVRALWHTFTDGQIKVLRLQAQGLADAEEHE